MGHPYHKVLVLTIHFEKSDMMDILDPDVQQVTKSFGSYNYDVERCAIPEVPDDLATSFLQSRLRQLHRYDDTNTLVILYYEGHGGDVCDPRSSETMKLNNFGFCR
jgi:hypothetical protein